MKEQKSILEHQQRTDPLLLKARHILANYTRATGAIVGILDHNGHSIPEAFDDVVTERNTCLYCMKCRSNASVNKSRDFVFHPCKELHKDGLKKAHSSGGCCSYTCDLGFMFWTNPVYSGKRFVGSVIGSGFLSVEPEEAAKKMEILCEGEGESAENKQKFVQLLSKFPRADSQHIDALSELMFICSESLSLNTADYYKTLRRRNEQQKRLLAITEQLKEKYPAGVVPEYPLEKEKALLNAVRRGDVKKGLRQMDELLGILLFTYPGEFRNLQLRILQLALLLSRTGNISGNVSNTFSQVSQQFLKSIEESQNPEELIDAIYMMMLHLANEAFSFLGIRHGSAMKKADQYIHENFARKLSLEEISAASGLSAPYFSTIFKEEMGESLSNYLNRLRVEKAASLLAETSMPLSEVTYACGFGDQSWFSKIFKIYTGMKPKEFRQKKRTSVLEIPKNIFSGEYMDLVKEQ
jgi:AraC-like DNA-binding protein/ligand-binding sensor protein